MKIGPPLLRKIMEYKMFRALSLKGPKPINVTASITFKCPSRCLTCKIWNMYSKEELEKEFSTDEWNQTFQSLGEDVVWITLSGGEPFIRKDLVDIIQAIVQYNNPEIINIPTNCMLPKRIIYDIEQILEMRENFKLILNLSLDGIGKDHDKIRGVKGNFEKVIHTYNELQPFRETNKNFMVGIHTVLSNFNKNKMLPLYQFVTQELKPDQYIVEVAEERGEMANKGQGITPLGKEFGAIMEKITELIKKDYNSASVPTQAFRSLYYKIAAQALDERRQIIPCYAGWASCQITPFGDVWGCCIRAESLGNLRENNFDFYKIWNSQKAQKFRKTVKTNQCSCPLANAHYTNMLCNFTSLSRIATKIVINKIFNHKN